MQYAQPHYKLQPLSVKSRTCINQIGIVNRASNYCHDKGQARLSCSRHRGDGEFLGKAPKDLRPSESTPEIVGKTVCARKWGCDCAQDAHKAVQPKALEGAEEEVGSPGDQAHCHLGASAA